MAAPTVQVTQKSGMGHGAILGVILAIVAIGVLVVVPINNSSDDSSTPTTAASATTEVPATTTAPGDRQLGVENIQENHSG